MKPPFDSAEGKPADSAQGRPPNRAYGRLLWLLRGRDPQEQRAIKDDAELVLDAARARGRGALAPTWLALMWDLVTSAPGRTSHGRFDRSGIVIELRVEAPPEYCRRFR